MQPKILLLATLIALGLIPMLHAQGYNPVGTQNQPGQTQAPPPPAMPLPSVPPAAAEAGTKVQMDKERILADLDLAEKAATTAIEQREEAELARIDSSNKAANVKKADRNEIRAKYEKMRAHIRKRYRAKRDALRSGVRKVIKVIRKTEKSEVPPPSSPY